MKQPPNGKRKHFRSFENLETYLFIDPKSAKERKENKEALEFAENVVAIRKAEYAQGRFELKNTAKAKRIFLNFFADLAEEKRTLDSSNNYGNWYSTYQHLKK